MKKYSIYIAILAVGLILGWLLFGGSKNADHKQHTESSETINQQWTCSMHPQIMQPESGDCPICGMELIPVESSADGLAPDQFKLTKNAMALANIQTTVITSGNQIANNLILAGKIKENEKSNAIQTAHFAGRIEKLYVNTTGELVNKGQLLALIYSPELTTTQGELLTALETKESQPDLYLAVRNKLKLWKLSEDQINQIETTKNIIANFPVYANVTGVVTKKMVDEGNYVKAGNPLLMIADLRTVWAEFDAYEKQIPFIKKGDEISITTNANPNTIIKAKVTFIDPILNTTTRVVIVRTELNNKNGDLKPGMFVEGVFTPKSSKNLEDSVITIPKTAVLWTGKRSLVYLKIKGDQAIFEMREVTLGAELSDQYEIVEGLQENDEIVTNGTFTVDAAAQLQGKKSMMNKSSGTVMTGHENHIGMQGSGEQEKVEDLKRINVSSKFQAQLKAVFNEYTVLKNAFVNDDSVTAQKAAITITKSLQKIDMKLLTDNKAHMEWMAILNTLETASAAISETTDIKSQRESFIGMSSQLAKSIELFGINQKVYKQFCPMANNDKGAFWLSTETHIKNPYFGEMMLKCGNVETIIE